MYSSTNDTIVSIYYYFGSKKEQIKHCRLRLAITNLNYDLFRRQSLEDHVCSCGYTAEHQSISYYVVPFKNSNRNKRLVN